MAEQNQAPAQPTPETELTDEEIQRELVSEFPDETWVTDEDWVDEINTRWRDVIKNLMAGQRIYEAYAHAYDIDITTPRGYNVARAAGARLLANVSFKKLQRKVLSEAGFNDELADMNLLDLMTNPKYEPSVRRAATKDYNELTGRIIKKVDHTTKGKRFEAPAVISTIQARNEPRDQEQAAAGN